MDYKTFGIYGRNFNIAIKNPNDGVYKDIGNIIVIEDSRTKYGVEAAFGESNTISKINGLKNSIQADYISYFINTNDNKKIKLADCVSVVTHLIHEGMKPGSKDTPRRVLREYIKAMLYWSEKNKINIDVLKDIIKEYEFFEYNFNTKYIKEFNEKLKKEGEDGNVL